jgi:multisubunit Na+/H+ antiporter MnhB subunit
MELVFKILAVILAGIAAYFLWQKNADGAFVSAVFGAVSFFLSVRFQIKERIQRGDAETRSKLEQDEPNTQD